MFSLLALTHMVAKRSGVAAVICALLLLALVGSACHADIEIITVQNSLPENVAIKVYNSYGRQVQLQREDSGMVVDAVILQAAEAAVIFIGNPATQPRYSLAVQDPAGKELFRRTLERKELDKRKWRIVITEQGIQ